MKTFKMFFVTFFLICLIPGLLTAQDISVHKFIGKTKADVIKKYGNPVHQDNSNPDMMCMFYQTKTNRMIFVSIRMVFTSQNPLLILIRKPVQEKQLMSLLKIQLQMDLLWILFQQMIFNCIKPELRPIFRLAKIKSQRILM